MFGNIKDCIEIALDEIQKPNEEEGIANLQLARLSKENLRCEELRERVDTFSWLKGLVGDRNHAFMVTGGNTKFFDRVATSAYTDQSHWGEENAGGRVGVLGDSCVLCKTFLGRFLYKLMSLKLLFVEFIIFFCKMLL